jgi:phospholipase D1/2
LPTLRYSSTTAEETLVQGENPRNEKSFTEKSTGQQASDKMGSSEKANGSGSAHHDKGKKTRGEPPFTKQERVEMEALLDELCGHLGQSLRI